MSFILIRCRFDIMLLHLLSNEKNSVREPQKSKVRSEKKMERKRICRNKWGCEEPQNQSKSPKIRIQYRVDKMKLSIDVSELVGTPFLSHTFRLNHSTQTKNAANGKKPTVHFRIDDDD